MDRGATDSPESDCTCSGFSVTINGYGFPAYAGINIYVNGTSYSNVTTDQYGTFTATYTPSKPGTYIFTTNFTYTYSVVGSVNKSATYPIPATLTVQSPTISISPSPPEQIVGGLVTITGTCLPPNALVKVSIGPVDATNLALNSSSTWTKVRTYVTPTGVYYTGYVTTSSSGSFSGRYVVPLLLPPGPYTVSVSVGSIPWSTSLTILSPTIRFVTSVYEGEQVSFTGKNFANFTLGYNMTIKLTARLHRHVPEQHLSILRTL